MLVVAIIGLLAGIALPKFSNLVDKARDAVVRGQTGTIRSAVGIYYADNAGMYPINPSALFTDLQNNPFVYSGGKYLETRPTIYKFAAHPNGANPPNGPGMVCCSVGPNDPDPTADALMLVFAAGLWHMNMNTGKVTLNCSHTDTSGRTWSFF